MPGLPHRPEMIPALAREQFPVLMANPGVVYLDNAATTQKPQAVIDAVTAGLAVQTANPGRGSYPWSTRAARRIAEIREQTARFIGASSPEEIVFTPGATAGLNAVALSWGLANLADGDEILGLRYRICYTDKANQGRAFVRSALYEDGGIRGTLMSRKYAGTVTGRDFLRELAGSPLPGQAGRPSVCCART